MAGVIVKDLRVHREAERQAAALALMEVITNLGVPTENPLSMLHGKISRI